MDWTVKAPAEANHNPRVVLNGRPGTEPLAIDAQVGLPLVLDAAGTTDPDGHALKYTWFFYPKRPPASLVSPSSCASGPPRPAVRPRRRAPPGFPSTPIGLREPPPRLVIENASGSRATVVAKAPASPT